MLLCRIGEFARMVKVQQMHEGKATEGKLGFRDPQGVSLSTAVRI